MNAEELLYQAWAVIANAGLHRGGWDHEDPEWVEAAEKWRDDWHRHIGTPSEQTAEQGS